MKNLNRLSIVVILFCISCSENAALFQEGLDLKEVNDLVAKDNSCKLTFYYSKQIPDQLVLILGSSYTDDYIPGKIIYEYYKGVSARKLNVNEYLLKDQKEQTLLNLTVKQLSSIQKDKERAEENVRTITNGNLDDVYQNMDTSITNHVKLDLFKAQFSSFTLGISKFGGFQINSDYVSIRFVDNNNNQIFLIYDIVSEEDKILGISVK